MSYRTEMEIEKVGWKEKIYRKSEKYCNWDWDKEEYVPIESCILEITHYTNNYIFFQDILRNLNSGNPDFKINILMRDKKNVNK